MELSDGALGALIGGFGGLLLGLAGQMGRFCTLGAIEDASLGGDFRRIRMWALALGLSIIGAFAMMEAGWLDPAATIYGARAWNPAASVVGGLIFGYGMAIAGNCGYGALVRLGGGDLRSLVIVLVMGVSAYVTIAGPLGALRLVLFPVETPEGAHGYAHALGAASGLPPIAFAALIGAGLIGAAVSSPTFRESATHWLWAAVAAAAILSGWAGTAWLAERSFSPIQVESHTFTAPVGETILYLMTASGGGAGFAIGSVAGVLGGAFAGAMIRNRFRWEACDDPRELGRQMLGGVLMGFGAVIAAGCSVGQGLTAFSTLAWSAPVVLASIIAGTVIGLRTMIQGVTLASLLRR